MRVLVADDDPITLRLLTHALEVLGYEVCAATSGAEAWEAYQQEPYPVVVSDWMMPDMDGLQLCQRIRQTSGEGYTYVILLSAQNEREDRLRALETGVDDFLSKPLDRAELAARLVIARRIHYWEASLREANDELRVTSELLAAQADELERMREEAVRLATYDSMTNVYSRRAWFERIESDLTALAIVDVDHFKSINDRFGHPVGDVVLAAVARRLGEATTPAGLVGRVGGEEFGIAFSCEVATAIQACERVLDAFQNPIDSIAEGNIGVTVSLGVAIAQLQGRTAVGALYEQADRALYQAKAAGRNRMSLVELKAA